MPKRPLVFTLFALLHAAVALSFPVQIMVLYHHSWLEWPLIFAKLSWLNIVVILLCTLNVILALKASPWLKLTLPASMIWVGFNNYAVSSYGQDFSFLETTMATIIFIMAHTTLLFANTSEIVHHPTLRWWLVPRRARLELPVWIKAGDGDFIPLKTFNLSKTGAFLCADGAESLPEMLKEGDSFTLAIKGEDITYTLEARLVRKAAPKGSYPEGLGIHFEKMGLGARLFVMKTLVLDFFAQALSLKTQS